MLDLDVLRFMQITLEHRVLNRYPGGWIPDTAPHDEGQVEWRSLEILKRELATRRWESDRMACCQSNGPDAPCTRRPFDLTALRDLTPHDLRPARQRGGYFMQSLRGHRLKCRSWFEDDLAFAELVGKPKQWKQPVPEDFEIVRGGNGSGAEWHFVDAGVLGIPAVNVLQLLHPLDALAVRTLDIDILRFIRLALWDWVNDHHDCDVEQRSLEIVRREIACRRWERKRAVEHVQNPDQNPPLSFRTQLTLF